MIQYYKFKPRCWINKGRLLVFSDTLKLLGTFKMYLNIEVNMNFILYCVFILRPHP